MNITEPVTMLTDYTLGLLCLGLGWKLFRLAARRRQTSLALWARAFFATALSAFLGGTVHGFALILSENLILGMWKATLYLTGIASFFMLSAVIVASFPPTLSRWGLGLATLKLAAYLVWMFNHQDFRFVVYDYGSAMLLILAFQLFAFYKKLAGAVWIVTGIVLSFVAAAIQQSGFSLHTHFNHNDLFHVVQMGAFYLLYRGGEVLNDYPKTGT
ncbi:hypothetical protein MYX82_05350 [Acidobacteria bacterium AH-259-D05]|nr:hypothetical protein [Acidobacteria bacterium AH-259-D05]